MAQYEIENIFKAECISEISVAVNGYSYLVIFGTHINGGFCCITAWGVGCELSSHEHFTDIGFNAERIGKALKNSAAGLCIAKAIAVTALYENEKRSKNEDEQGYQDRLIAGREKSGGTEHVM